MLAVYKSGALVNVNREIAAGRTMSEIRHLIHFRTIELASLDQTNYLTNLWEGRAYFGDLREGLRLG